MRIIDLKKNTVNYLFDKSQYLDGALLIVSMNYVHTVNVLLFDIM